ncbi:MAG: hypothetical protein ACKVPX_16125 [Myxococcaceae bacterium]
MGCQLAQNPQLRYTTEMATMPIARARALVKQVGPGGILRHVARRALTTAPDGDAFRLFLMVLNRPRALIEVRTGASNHTFRFATLEDIETLRQAPETQLAERDMRSLSAGSRCLLQWDGVKLVGYTWVSGTPLVELMWGLHFNMPDDMVYTHNAFTMPEYRGRGFQALRDVKVFEDAHAHGKTRLLAYVDHLNYKSLHGIVKGGYQRVGVLRGVRRKGRIEFSMSVDDTAWARLTRSGPHQTD